MRVFMPAAVAVLLGAGGCTTTEEANVAMQSAWIGRDGDDFFSAYGPPFRSFERDDGGTIHSWRGGQTTRIVPAQYSTIDDGEERTRTTVVTDEDGNSVVETETSVEEPTRVMTVPAREQPLFCEAQITTDADGVIQAIGATRDTDGEGFSFSRCGELFKPGA